MNSPQTSPQVLDVTDEIFEEGHEFQGLLNVGVIQEPEKVSETTPQTSRIADESDGMSIESIYRGSIATDPLVTIYNDPNCGEYVPMFWGGLEWSPLDKKMTKVHAEAFCSKFKKAYKNSLVISCADLLEPALINVGRPLRSHRRRHLIGVRNNMMLELLPDGRIEFLPWEKDLYLPVVVDVEIYPQRCVEERETNGRVRRFYEPLDMETIYQNAPMFSSLVKGLFPDQGVLDAYQMFFGDVLTAVKSQRFAVLEGVGGNGKSQLLQVWSGLVTKGIAYNFNKSGSFDMEQLFMCTSVACDEFKKGRIDTTLIKQILGRSIIPVNRKFMSHISYRVDAKHQWAFNESPEWNDHSGAIESRLVRFMTAPVVKRGRDGEIQDLADLILDTERSMVFQWALHGALEVIRRGHVPTDDELPESMRKARSQALVEADPTLGFVEDYEITAELNKGDLYTKEDVYELMLEWFRKEGRTGSAQMSKDSAMRSLKRVLEKKCGHGCLGSKEVKPEVFRNGQKKRWPCIRLIFAGQPPIKPISRLVKDTMDEALENSYQDAIADNGPSETPFPI